MQAKLPGDEAEEGLLSEEESEDDEDVHFLEEMQRVRVSGPRMASFCAAGSLLLLAAAHLLPRPRDVEVEEPRELARPGLPDVFDVTAMRELAKQGSPDDSEAPEFEAIPEAADRYPPGVVDGVYTYGAPGIANPPLEDLHREDHCFEGLRSYTEDVLGPVTRQVDAAAMSNSYAHPKVATAVLHDGVDTTYATGCGKPTWPSDQNGDSFMEWRLHWEEKYTPRLERVTVNRTDYASREPFSSASDFVILAYKAYDNTKNTREAISNRLPEWKLVAKETRVSGAGSFYDEDPLALVQNEASMECVVVFTGTNNFNELTTAEDTGDASYCGFANVHEGYRLELWSLLKDLWPALRPKVSKCSKVSCVGHSMGGSLCELFAACANSGRSQDPDYRQQAWNRSRAEAMDEITIGGVLWLPGAERRCEEPPCWKV